MKPYMLTAQHNDDSPDDDSFRALCEQQANRGGYFLLNLRNCPKEQDSTWDTSLGFSHQFAWTHPIVCWNWRASPSSLRFRETSCRSIFLKLPEVTEKRYFLLIWKKFTSRDIWNKKKTILSEREKRELFRQHRNLGHPQPTELARALRHAGARREAFRFVLKELRCPTCEARHLPLPRRPGMLPRCLRFNECIGVNLVDLEVRDGTSAKALNVVCFSHCGQVTPRRLWKSSKLLGWNIMDGRRSLYMIRVQNSWEMSSRTQQELQASGLCRSIHRARGKMEKQKERDSHSNINCVTWMKSVTLKVRQILKPQWPSVVMRGTDVAIGQVFCASTRVWF